MRRARFRKLIGAQTQSDTGWCYFPGFIVNINRQGTLGQGVTGRSVTGQADGLAPLDQDVIYHPHSEPRRDGTLPSRDSHGSSRQSNYCIIRTEDGGSVHKPHPADYKILFLGRSAVRQRRCYSNIRVGRALGEGGLREAEDYPLPINYENLDRLDGIPKLESVGSRCANSPYPKPFNTPLVIQGYYAPPAIRAYCYTSAEYV